MSCEYPITAPSHPSAPNLARCLQLLRVWANLSDAQAVRAELRQAIQVCVQAWVRL